MRPFTDGFSTILQAYSFCRCLDKKKLNSSLSLGLSDWLAGGTHLLQVLIGQYEFLLVF